MVLRLLQSLLFKFGSHKTRVKVARKWGVEVGERCWLFECYFGSEPYLVTIGNHCLIAAGVKFITHDGGIWVFIEDHAFAPRHGDATRFGPIVVHDNCMIGENAIIMPDVEIGPSSVVGAGSVVTRDVAPYTVVAGNPATYIESYDEYLEKCRLKDSGRIDDSKKKEQLIQRFKNR